MNPVARSTSRTPSPSPSESRTQPKEPEDGDTECDEDNEQQQLKEQLYATMLGFEEVERSESLNLRFLKEDRA